MAPETTLELLGSIFALAGAYFLSSQNKLGFLAHLAGGICFFAFACLHGFIWLGLLQIAFGVLNVRGLKCWQDKQAH